MRLLYFITLILLLSCKHDRDNTNFYDKTQFEFKLIDSLGTVSINFPPRTDTFFSWIQKSDCGKPCENGDYRFQSKSNRIFKESGFFWNGEPEDSVDQLSIYHERPDSVFKFYDSLIIQLKDHLLKKVLNDAMTSNIISDTLVKIGDRHFYIFRVADIDKKRGIRDRRLIAFTTVSGTILEFHYKLLTTKYDTTLTQFFEKSIENLKTVRLKDGG